MAVALNSTAKGIIMVFRCSILKTPLIISGKGTEDMLSLEDTEIGGSDVGADGVRSVYIKPAQQKGTITLLPGSSAVGVFRQVQEAQYNTSTPPLGQLIVTNPGAFWSVTYNNLLITNSFKGFEATNEKVKDVPVMFTSDLPTANSIGDTIQLIANISAAIL